MWNESVATLFRSLGIAPQFASTTRHVGTSSATPAAPVAARSSAKRSRSRCGPQAPSRPDDRRQQAGKPSSSGVTASADLQPRAGSSPRHSRACMRHPRINWRRRRSLEAVDRSSAAPDASKIVAPVGGMSALMDRLVERLRQHGATLTFGARLESLDPSVPTVVATCASAAARLVEPHAPHLGAALASLADDDDQHVDRLLSKTRRRSPRVRRAVPARMRRRGPGRTFRFRHLSRRSGSEVEGRDVDHSRGRVELSLGPTPASCVGPRPSIGCVLTGRIDEPVDVVTTCRPRSAAAVRLQPYWTSSAG